MRKLLRCLQTNSTTQVQLHVESETLRWNWVSSALKMNTFVCGYWEGQFFVCRWIFVWVGSLKNCSNCFPSIPITTRIGEADNSGCANSNSLFYKDKVEIGTISLKTTRLFPNRVFRLLECPRIKKKKKFWNLWQGDDFKAEMCNGPLFSYLKFSGWSFSPKKLGVLCVLYWKERWNCLLKYAT